MPTFLNAGSFCDTGRHVFLKCISHGYHLSGIFQEFSGHNFVYEEHNHCLVY